MLDRKRKLLQGDPDSHLVKMYRTKQTTRQRSMIHENKADTDGDFRCVGNG
jgi:hypothetical protein